MVVEFVKLHSIDLLEAGLELSRTHHRSFGEGIDGGELVKLGVAEHFHDVSQGFYILFPGFSPIDAAGLRLGSFVDKGVEEFLNQQEEPVMEHQVMKRGGAVGMEDLFEQGPVFERDGFGIGMRHSACLPE